MKLPSGRAGPINRKDLDVEATLRGKKQGDELVFKVSATEIGFEPKRVWCPTPSYHHRTRPYSLPKTVSISTHSTEEAGARFSPSPYAVIVENGRRRAFVGVSADAGWHQWNHVSFDVNPQGVTVRVDLEGHTPMREAARHIHAHVIMREGIENRHAQLHRSLTQLYPEAMRPPKEPAPDWWTRPIYCGWGDQVGMSMALEGPGLEPRALAYNIQGLYERWVRRLDQAGVPFGTVIIDAGWSMGGAWKPLPMQWPDLKGFIARQHDLGRHVLLWIAPWHREGVPAEWCIRSGKRRLLTDPSHPSYRQWMEEQVHSLLSPDGYDADGFKIDQLAFVPSERGCWASEHFGRRVAMKPPYPRIRHHSRSWGCEFLREAQKAIYDAAKLAKPDALITSSTVHPYFHDSFDMVRLHDSGLVKGDVVTAMKARSDLSRAALPWHKVDADDWVWRDFDQWLYYTLNSHTIGVPCLFYAENFMRSFSTEPAATPMPMSTLRKIARAWTRIQGTRPA